MSRVANRNYLGLFLAFLCLIVLSGMILMPTISSAGTETHAVITDQLLNHVSIVDFSVEPPTLITKIPVSGSPFGLAITPDKSKALVTILGEGKVAVIDLKANPPVLTSYVSVGGLAYGIDISPDGGYAIVSDGDQWSSEVSIIDLTFDPPVYAGRVGVGQGLSGNYGSTPYDAVITADSQEVVVALYRRNGASVIDMTAIPPSEDYAFPLTSLFTSPYFPSPIAIGTDPSRTTAIINNIGTDHYYGTDSVSIVDLTSTTYSVNAEVIVGRNPGSEPDITADGSLGLVANSDDNNVSIIDLNQNPPAVVATVPVGTGPRAVEIIDKDNTALVANRGNHTISRIDLNTLSVVNTYNVYSAAFGNTWEPNRIAVYEQETPNFPPVADANGPYQGNEGSAVVLDGSGSSDPEGAPLQYRWDFDNDGTWDTNWSINPTSENTWGDDFSGTVVLEVTDGDFTDQATASVNILNTDASVEAGADQQISEGDSIDLDPATFLDAGIDDTHIATIDWGDNSPVEAGDLTEMGVQGFQPVGASAEVPLTDYFGNPLGSFTIDNPNNAIDGIPWTNWQGVSGNIAPLGVTAEVNEGSAANTLDGNMGTSWQGAADNPWIKFDLGELRQVSGFRQSSGIWPGNPYTAWVSADDVTYEQVQGGTLTQNNWGEIHFAQDKEIRFIKLFVERTDATGFGELANLNVLVNHAWIKFDLGEEKSVAGFRETSGGFPANPYVLYASTDDVSYTEVSSGSLTQSSFGDHLFSTSTQARYLKLFLERTDATGYGELVDFEALVPSRGTVAGSHTYTDDGNYTVTVAVEDDDGGTGTDSFTVDVNNVAPTASATNDSPNVEGNAVTVTALASDPGSGDSFTYSFDWDNDGNYDIVDQESAFAEHTFDQDGVYTVGVRVRDDDGGVGEATTLAIVTDGAPASDFSFSQDPLIGGSDVQFTDESTSSPDSIVAWAWDFGDGSISIEQNPFHAYGRTGTFNITLTVTDSDGSEAAVTHTVVITALSMIDVTIDTVDPLGNHLEDGVVGYEYPTYLDTPYTLTMPNGGHLNVFAQMRLPNSWAGTAFWTNAIAPNGITKDTTYWVDGITHELINTEITPGTTKVNVVFEMIDVVVDAVDQAGNHLDGSRVIRGGGASWYDTSHVYKVANGANASFYVNWNGRQGSRVLTLLKGFTYSVDALTNELIDESPSANPAETKVNFVFEPIEVIVDAVDQAGDHLDGSRVIRGGGASWYDTSHVYTVANGANASFYVNWGGLQGSRVLTLLKGVTYQVDARTNELIDEGPSANPEETKVNFVFESIEVEVDGVDNVNYQHVDGTIVRITPTNWLAGPQIYTMANGGHYTFWANLDGVQSSKILTMSKGTTYLLDAQTDEIISEESSVDPQQTKVHFAFETNRPPEVDAGGPYTVTEGSPVLFDAGNSIDLDGDQLDYRWDFDNDGNWDTPYSSNATATFTWSDDYSGAVKLEVSDGQLTDVATADVNVNNEDPSVGAITVPVDPIIVDGSIDVSASFTDPGILDSHTAVWDWGDETTSTGMVIETDGSGVASDSHSYNTPGVYEVMITVNDKDGGSGTVIAAHYVVVYDPSAGFVTGGGWIDSTEGAYVADASLTGKANFGFVSRYKKGATAPTGQTEFQFKVADLNFHSTTYDWLVVAGTKAQYKGSGTINGEGNYGFMLTATDAQIKDNPDKFRIKIWEIDGEMVYDNNVGAGDSADPATVLGGGSIVIHK